MNLTKFSKGGGCGCKIAPSVLQQIVNSETSPEFANLLVGIETSDDAAVYKISETEAVISTTDFFVPIVDDPYDFGRIAAANAISDVYAMGGTPLMAVAILGWPLEQLPVDAARAVLAGGRAVCSEAGIPLAGGHTIDTAEPIFGLAVTGMVPVANLKRNSGAVEGDLLFLTKPVGVGVLATALKRGLLAEEYYPALINQMTSLNKAGKELGALEAVHAMTDVTGFGILGHLMEMAEGSGLTAEINYQLLPKMAGLEEYLKQRTIPDATFRNWNSYNARVQFQPGVNVMEAFNVLPDPQTNGGLLFAAAPEKRTEVQDLLTKLGLGAHTEPIGRFLARGEKVIVVA